MTRQTLFTALVVLWLLPTPSVGQTKNKPEWATGYPKTSPNVARGIAIKGKCTVDTDWTIKSIELQTWESGGKVLKQNIDKYTANNEWATDVNGNWVESSYVMPKPETNYNALVEVVFEHPTLGTETLRTDSVIVKSKKDE